MQEARCRQWHRNDVVKERQREILADPPQGRTRALDRVGQGVLN